MAYRVGTTGMSAKEILNYAPHEPDIVNARYVRFKELKNVGTKDQPVLSGWTVTAIPGDKPRSHYQTVKARNPNYKGKLSECSALSFSCDCLVGDTRVLTDKGWKTIYSMVDHSSNPIKEFPINYIVNGKIYPGSVPFFKGLKGTLKIELDNGNNISATRDHKIRVLTGYKQKHNYIKNGINQKGVKNNNSYIWEIIFKNKKIIVKDVKNWAKQNGFNYSNICSFANGLQNKPYKGITHIEKIRPKRKKKKLKFISSKTSPIYKWIKVKNLKIGDKVAVNSSKYFPEVERDSSYWKSYFIGVFHGDGTFNPLSIECHSHFGIMDRIKNSGVKFNPKNQGRFLLGRTAIEILSEFGITKQTRHFIPIEKLEIYAFLSGLIDTDGYIAKDGHSVITGDFELKKVADKLVALGVNGIKFGLYRKKGTVTNLGTSTKDSFYVKIGAKGMRQLSLNLCSVKYQAFIPKKKFQNKENITKIIRISKRGPKYVYDIHVPKIHRFVAESIIVHNCERFKFHWEYALHRQGAAEIIYGNGDPPVETNPQMIPGCCKHGFIILKTLIKARR